MEKNYNRPKYLNLLKIRMPVTAVVSIAHRISGFLLVICIPLLIYLFQLSLENAQSYDKLSAILQLPVVKVVLIVITWAIAHHFAAGIRFLLIDIDLGVTKTNARRGAWIVNIVAVVFTIYIAVKIL